MLPLPAYPRIIFWTIHASSTKLMDWDFLIHIKSDLISRALNPGIFIQAAPAPRGQKHVSPALDYWSSLAKYLFPKKLLM